MDKSHQTIGGGGEERASLYALDLLTAAERREFEQQLRSDPKLRELVRELQGNLEAMVASAPARPAPVHVWGHIAAQVGKESGMRLAYRRPLKVWATRLLAAAACLALGAFLHAWWSAPPPKTPLTTAEHSQPRPAARLSPPVVAVLPPAAPGTSARPRSLPPTPATATNAETVLHLREQVRLLASQVEALNHVLTQQAHLPSGFSRLHVFRLVPAHEAHAPSGQAEVRSWPEALAELAAGQPGGAENQPTAGLEDANPSEFVAANGGLPPNETASLEFHPPLSPGGIVLGGTGAPESAHAVVSPTTGSDLGAAPSTPQSPAEPPASSGNPPATASAADTTGGDLVAAAGDTSTSAALALNAGQPVGFYDPDSGRGSIALLGVRAWQGGQTWPTDQAAQFNYVVWESLRLNTGALQVRSVGMTPAGGYPGVISFSAETRPGANPSFFVTLEPGEITEPGTPTGPVVAGPP